ncbi:unnamed protein product [Camellia sinensis]
MRGMVMAQSTRSTTTVQVKVGVVLDMYNWVGKMGLKSIYMALSDFYLSHVHYKTRLDLYVRNSKDNVVGAAAAVQAVDLLKTDQVKAIIGPLTSMQANFLIHLGVQAHVPIISFSATSPSLSYLRSPYFFRAALNDSSQVQPITAIIQAFKWKEVVPIYTENEYGEGLIPFLTNTFQENEIRVLYKSIIHPLASDEEIVAELYKLMTMQTRVFIVHMTHSLSTRLFTKANEIGMMSEGYVWIITDGTTNSFNFFDPSIIIDSMQGVIGVQPHVPKSKKLEDFISRWKNKAHQEKTSSDLNVFGLWAYDAATALAMAVEKVGALNLSISNIAKNSTTDFESVGVSQNGIDLCLALSSAPRFRGLSGDFSFVDGQIQSSAFEIVNMTENGPRGIGFWTPEQGIVKEFNFDAVNTSCKNYSTSRTNHKAIMWPGDTICMPKGWDVPTSGKVLRVGVLQRHYNSDFVRVKRDAITNKLSFDGYCIDVFKAVMEALPYSVPYEFIPFDDKGAYDALLGELSLGPQPTCNNSAQYILKPEQMELKDDNKIDTTTNSTELSPEYNRTKEKIVSNLARFVMIIWCFVVLTLTQSYMASLTSMLTVHRLEPSITNVRQLINNGQSIGYPNASFVGDILKGMNFSKSQLKGYNTVHGDLDAAFSNQSIVAAFDEIPYMKLFTRRHCSKYTMVAPTYKTGGFGFAFCKGSHLVCDVSTAILHVFEEGKMSEIEKKWLLSDNCPDSSSTASSSNLSVNSFRVLFLIVGVAASFALIIFMAMLAYEHRSFLMHLDLKALWRKYILKHEDTATDTATVTVTSTATATATATGIDTHQDQASPPSSPLSISPSPPTQHSLAQSTVSDDTDETFTHFEGEVAESHNPRH